MTSITLTVSGARARATVNGPLTSGMVGIPVTIECDDTWDGLTRNLVCRCSPWGSDDGEARAILHVENTAAVAHEVMQAGLYLYLGLEGFSSDGQLVIPTTWARCGKIRHGANSDEDVSTAPELPVWNQLQTEMEQLRQDVVLPEHVAEFQTYVQTATQAAASAERASDSAAAASSLAVSNAAAARNAADLAQTSEENARTSATSAANLANGALQAQRAAEAAAQRAEAAADALQSTLQKEVTTTVTVGSDPVTLDAAAPEQIVNLAWAVEGARTVPEFHNYYIARSSYSYPRAFDTAYYVSFFTTAAHGDADAFASGHRYFHAMHYAMDGDSTATLNKWGTGAVTPDGSATLSGSGWAYGATEVTAAQGANFSLLNSGTGTGVIDYVYCIDITTLEEAGTISEGMTAAELAELFGGLELVPGEDYPGGTIGDGTATLSIDRGGEISTVDNETSTATVKGGDILSVEGGSVTFLLKVIKTVAAGEVGKWEGVKWVAFGDSLTDGSINADTKYHKLIAEATGITVVDMGKGGTGYWRTSEDGTAFYQRMAYVPADADIITIFGSVNDWRFFLTEGNTVGSAADTLDAGTLAGYINEAINVAIATAPYAQLALVTPLAYHGIKDSIMEDIAGIIVAVAKQRKIKCLDLYHESGFRVDDPVFAQVYCTDYSETADTYGHPSNLAHEKIIAPEILGLLERMILTA